MSTKRLARELGLIRKHTPSSSAQQHHRSTPKQLFSYLIIIDFESTCWREKNNYGQEIIEFPAVLLNTCSGEMEAEFHSYVQPQEHPVLSDFCTELTGITQKQVEAGPPLHICVSSFKRWLQVLQHEKGVVFNTGPAPSGHPCTFVTWSDWDLGVCLEYECKRKQISKPEALNSWIDLRATYRLFYSRKPKGLSGALQDLGIQFSGREHSGLDDARNTARLAWRMMSDGCVMKVTKSLCRVALMPRRVCVSSKTRERHTGETDGSSETAAQTHTHPAAQGHQSSHTHTSVCKSLVSPRTVLSSVTTLLCVNTPHLHTTLQPSSSSSSSSSHPPHLTVTSDPCTPTNQRSEEVLLLEVGESTSYDDVLLEDEEGVMVENEDHGVYTPHNTHSAQSSASLTDRAHITSHTPGGPKAACDAQLNNFPAVTSHSVALTVPTPRPSKPRPSNPASTSTAPVPPTDPYTSLRLCRTPSIPLVIYRDQSEQPSALGAGSSGGGTFRVPSSVLSSRANRSGLSSYMVNQSLSSSCSANQSTLSSISINQSARSSSSTKRGSLPSVRGGAKITAPLCGCGRRARRLTVCNGGPNHGRAFYTCSARRSDASGLAPRAAGCGFFKWESSVLQSTLRQSSFTLNTTASRSFR